MFHRDEVVVDPDGLSPFLLCICVLMDSSDGHPTAMERLSKRLLQMKMLLYGDGEKEVDKDKCLVSIDGKRN